MFLIDYHLHTNRSTDAKHSLMEVCRYALAKGINEIAVTDHFEPTSKDPSYKAYHPKTCLSDIKEAKRRYKGLISIKFGIELGHPHLYPEYSEKIIENYPYDFVLASGHKMSGDIDFSEINYAYSDTDKFCEIYLKNLKELALWGKYDCIGHFDLLRRYAARQGIEVNLMNFKEQIEEILKIIIDKGKGIEINTSGLRQYTKDCLPNYDIIKFYRELGGEIITIGSDAHSASEVGAGVKEGIQLAAQAGFDYITIFDKRMPQFIKINNMQKNMEKHSVVRLVDIAANM